MVIQRRLPRYHHQHQSLHLHSVPLTQRCTIYPCSTHMLLFTQHYIHAALCCSSRPFWHLSVSSGICRVSNASIAGILSLYPVLLLSVSRLVVFIILHLTYSLIARTALVLSTQELNCAPTGSAHGCREESMHWSARIFRRQGELWSYTTRHFTR